MPDENLHILEHTASSRIGGVETYLFRLTGHLKEQGWQVSAVTRPSGPVAAEFTRRGIPTHGYHSGSRFALGSIIRLVRLIKRERVSLIHTHVFSANTLGALAARICGIPSIARVPSIEGADRYRKSTYVTAVSRNVARHIAAQGLPAERIRVLYNGVDWRHFQNLPEKSIARQQWSLPDDAYVIACIASLTKRKGQQYLLDAAAPLPNAHILLAGEGDQEQPLRAQAERLGITNRVHFLGFQPDVRQVLAAADVKALPSSQEGLPNSVLEAQAAGVAVVSTNIAGTPEIILNNQTGLLIEPEQVEPLARALAALRDAELRRELSRRALTMVQKEFDSQVCLQKVETFLRGTVVAWRSGRGLVPPDLSWQDIL